MSTNQLKNPSRLVQAVLNLDNYLSELVRLGSKIELMELKSEFDFEQMQKLMNRFTECGQGVSDEVMQLSNNLHEARAQAEEAAKLVATRAEQLQARKVDEQNKMDQLRALSEKVRELTTSLNDYSSDDQEQTAIKLGALESRLRPLIEEARQLKNEAQIARFKILEQSADSLEQSLSAISRKVSPFQRGPEQAH